MYYKQPFHRTRSFPRQNRNTRTVDVSLIMKNAQQQLAQPVQQTQEIQHQFADFSLCLNLQRNIGEKGYATPTPIQDKIIPLIMQGADVVGIANTGTGKTAAFLIPLIQKLFVDRNQKVLIVVPTRELAIQIHDEFMSFTKGMQLNSVVCIGGVGMYQQIQGLRRNPTVVIGTPGRLKDLKNQGKLSIGLFSTIVLDEVDRMLDMGFVHDVKFILSFLPKPRQSLFFSATMPQAVKDIIRTLSLQPVTVSVKVQETTANINQQIIKTHGRAKFDILCELLRQKEFEKVLVFGRTKWGIEKLSKQLLQKGLQVAALHGNKSQNQRLQAMDLFRRNRIRILLATDVVARGIDVDNITHVINYDLPENYDAYVHRIGRTGRNNKKGIALSLVE